MTTSALSAHVNAADDAFLGETDMVEGMLLPTVKISDAGVFVPQKGNDPNDMDKLPDGGKASRDGIHGLVIASRTGVLSWKKGYDDRGDDESPAFVAFTPASNATDAELIGKAVKARQMCPKDEALRKRFDFDQNGVGHLKPLQELLVWLPDTGFTIIATAPNYYDVVDGIAALKVIRDVEGLAAALLKPVTKPHKSGKYTWDSNFCSIALAPADIKAKLEAGFAEYQEIIKENLDLKDRVDRWLSCSDRPMTEEIRAALAKAVTLVPPKF